MRSQDVIVINKPAGMVVHPAPGNRTGTLVNALLSHCGDSLSGINGIKRPGIVHRLDKETSGLLVAAKNDRAHRSLATQLVHRDMSRIYEALVWGRLLPLNGTIEGDIGRDPHNRKRMAIRWASGLLRTCLSEGPGLVKKLRKCTKIPFNSKEGFHHPELIHWLYERDQLNL
jgi:Pseudouridylate synthases, 23S RNA-specific